ncbi:MAG: FKBP-type peptidyl-prolyl cis-trans isomerase [Treponema sp.]|jgi:FKBP-type peptidyl-prolyl cis-trans isomerase|nr:FKBP-type peptidyl-prolyl cis-trans isomerase [Treponema sp.]
MKKLCIFLFLLLPALTLYAKAIQEDFRKADEKARMSYAFGMIIASDLRNAVGDTEFDYTAFSQGMKAVLENSETSLSEMEAIEIVETALQNVMDRKAEESRIAEELFLAVNRERPGVQATASGLLYEVLSEGEGKKPGPDSVVKVHYEGRLADGRLFDTSYNGDEGAIIPLDRVISGWTEGIMLMNVGSKYRIYIPSNLAYGKTGFYDVIPPFSTLIFTVELLEIINPDEEEGTGES